MVNRNKENAEKTEAAAKRRFPNEKWIDVSEAESQIKGISGHDDFKGIKVAHPKILEGDKNTLAKEIRQAKILTDRGDCVYLLPKAKDEDGKPVSGPDALLNGELYEFKTITGNIDRVAERFSKSRRQSDNVYLRISNPNITKDEVFSMVNRVLNKPTYTGTTKGWLILTLDGTGKTHKRSIRSLK
ncbi:MAG: hypothetical protein FWG66_05420 [Spirochaetes bacterium]|nr:hypothetical protein [Spirochaetota bacterium]